MTHIQMKEVGEVVLGEDEVEGLDDGPMNGEEIILVWKKMIQFFKNKWLT